MSTHRLANLARVVFTLLAVLPGSAAHATDGWQPVVVYSGPDFGDQPLSEAQKQPPPVVYTKPVTMRPPLPVVRAAQEDAREIRILNGSAPGPRTYPLLSTGNNPEPLPPSARQPTPASANSPSNSPSPASARRRGEPPPEDATPGQQYCFNIADAAADARFAWQQKTLLEIEQELEKRVALLEEKTKEYKVWLARREEFVGKAQEGLMKIYARMRPDAAALQIAAMDEETAAALMAKLDPRTSSAIMAEMDPQVAARLSGTMAGAARTGESREQAAANAKALQGERKQ
jgi:flagellar motility protein MotE (MotC chaperone)